MVSTSGSDTTNVEARRDEAEQNGTMRRLDKRLAERNENIVKFEYKQCGVSVVEQQEETPQSTKKQQQRNDDALTRRVKNFFSLVGSFRKRKCLILVSSRYPSPNRY